MMGCSGYTERRERRQNFNSENWHTRFRVRLTDLHCDSREAEFASSSPVARERSLLSLSDALDPPSPI